MADAPPWVLVPAEEIPGAGASMIDVGGVGAREYLVATRVADWVLKALPCAAGVGAIVRRLVGPELISGTAGGWA